MNGAGCDEQSAETDERLVGVDLNDADERAHTGAQGPVVNDVIDGGLHDGCFGGGDGLFERAAAKRWAKAWKCEVKVLK